MYPPMLFGRWSTSAESPGRVAHPFGRWAGLPSIGWGCRRVARAPPPGLAGRRGGVLAEVFDELCVLEAPPLIAGWTMIMGWTLITGATVTRDDDMEMLARPWRACGAACVWARPAVCV